MRLLASVSLQRCQPAKVHSAEKTLTYSTEARREEVRRQWGWKAEGRGGGTFRERQRECLSACVREGERAFTSACLLS